MKSFMTSMCVAIVLGLVPVVCLAAEQGGAVGFRRTQLDKMFRSEGVAVGDFNADGDNDVLSSSAHRFGIWWHEQTPDGWKTHQIDKGFSQTHAVCLADINGDGLADFVTGKRWWAHMGGDPGSRDPALVVWYELARKDGRPVWTKHVIDADSGVGTQFEVADLNGVYYFRQTRR